MKRRRPGPAPTGSPRKPVRKRRPPARAQPDDRRLLLELQVHQEELRQQNDELRNTQHELELARDRYSGLYDMAPLPYLTVTRQGAIAEANQTCLNFLGLPRERLVDRALASLLPPDQRPRLRQALARPRHGGAIVLQTRVFAARGAAPVELHMRPGADGMSYAALVDLSERERSAAERQALLVEAEVARASSAAKDQFLANMSHELRTPLTPVLMAVSALQQRWHFDAPTLQDLHESLDLIRRNLEHETRLIDDLLDISRLNAAKLNLEPQPVHLHGIIQDAVDLMEPEAARKPVRLRVQLRAHRHRVFGDPMRLRQVIWNLLHNAVKFTPAGGTVTISSRSRDRLISVQVRDTGLGIDRVALPGIFDRFAQTDDGARAGGLGLGLAIARGIVEAHGGRLTAASAGRGKGAIFSVDLAVSRGRSDVRRRRPVQQMPSLPGNAAGPRRILLVDDHEETAALMARLLGDHGFEVKVAHTLRQALAAAATGVDLLISDIGLPDGSGLELVSRLRGERDIPAIALSGYGQPSDLERSRAAGFVRHLIKPVSFPQLLQAIAQLARAGAG